MPNRDDSSESVSQDKGKGGDHSLRGAAMRRAMRQQLPKTLTPFEWEEWYKDKGVPESHQIKNDPPRRRWWCPLKIF